MDQKSMVFHTINTSIRPEYDLVTKHEKAEQMMTVYGGEEGFEPSHQVPRSNDLANRPLAMGTPPVYKIISHAIGLGSSPHHYPIR